MIILFNKHFVYSVDKTRYLKRKFLQTQKYTTGMIFQLRTPSSDLDEEERQSTRMSQDIDQNYKKDNGIDNDDDDDDDDKASLCGY